MVNFFYRSKTDDFCQNLLHIVFLFKETLALDALETLIFSFVNIYFIHTRQKLPTINVLFT